MVEAIFLHRPVIRDPGFLVLELMGAEAAIPNASDFFGDDKARILEDFHVLLDARKGHVEALRQIADRRIRPAKPLQNSPASRIRKGAKGVVEMSLILNHMVQYITITVSGQPLESVIPPVAASTRAGAARRPDPWAAPQLVWIE